MHDSLTRDSRRRERIDPPHSDPSSAAFSSSDGTSDHVCPAPLVTEAAPGRLPVVNLHMFQQVGPLLDTETCLTLGEDSTMKTSTTLPEERASDRVRRDHDVIKQDPGVLVIEGRIRRASYYLQISVPFGLPRLGKEVEGLGQ